MGYAGSNHATMTLYGRGGERKYLNVEERLRFYRAIYTAPIAPRTRLFCKLIYWTGCRPSEALNVSRKNVVVGDSYVIFRSLKKRGKDRKSKYRIVPIPRELAGELDREFEISAACRGSGKSLDERLFEFGRTTGWSALKCVMETAHLSGIRACARGLRHSFACSLLLAGVDVTKVQLWMGHENIATTMIYLQLDIADDRRIAERMWQMHQDMCSIDAPSSTLPSKIPSNDNDVTGAEIVRLITAYSAIAERAARLEMLSSIEASANLAGVYG